MCCSPSLDNVPIHPIAVVLGMTCNPVAYMAPNKSSVLGFLAVSYTPPRILVESTSSPYFIHGVHLQSFSSLLHFQSTPNGLLMESTWSPGGVDWRWILDLAKFKESLSEVLVDSM